MTTDQIRDLTSAIGQMVRRLESVHGDRAAAPASRKMAQQKLETLAQLINRAVRRSLGASDADGGGSAGGPDGAIGADMVEG